MLTVTFEEVDTALAAIDAPLAAAEAHGSLCGSLAAVGGLTAAAWVAELVPAAAEMATAAGEEQLRSRNLLGTLFDETASSLASQDMEFLPLLPDDQEPLERRVTALAQWCTGFLYGIGTGSLPAHDELPAELAEVLGDFAEISRATVDTDETEESSETSYAELTEFLRAGVQLAYEELVPHRARRGRA